MSKAHFSSTIFPFAEQAAARERARIRRLIGPALTILNGFNIPRHLWDEAMAAIDAATRPEPKRKRGAK